MIKNKEAINVLMVEFKRLGGEVFSEFYVRINADDETKKALEANDFLESILTAKPIRKEWKLEDSDNFKKLNQIVKAINILNN